MNAQPTHQTRGRLPDADAWQWGGNWIPMLVAAAAREDESQIECGTLADIASCIRSTRIPDPPRIDRKRAAATRLIEAIRDVPPATPVPRIIRNASVLALIASARDPQIQQQRRDRLAFRHVQWIADALAVAWSQRYEGATIRDLRKDFVAMCERAAIDPDGDLARPEWTALKDWARP